MRLLKNIKNTEYLVRKVRCGEHNFINLHEKIL